MGISRMIARAMLQEHKYKPITGSGSFIGRQTMPFTLEAAIQLIQEEDVTLVDKGKESALKRLKGFFGSITDEVTRYGKGKGYIRDAAFFNLFCDAKFQALDVTDYEGAEIVHNMHEPIPDSLANSVDFMFNGSCLDNMADPMTAMKNTTKMLRPGGRVVLMESGSPHHNAYLMYSPAWFFDYFAVNKYADCKVYICLFEPTSHAIHHGPYDLFVWKKFEATLSQFPLMRFPPNKAVITYVVAEKGADSTWDKIPVQGQYRPEHTHTIYRQAFERFSQSKRPIFRRPSSELTSTYYWPFIEQQGNYDDIEYVGSLCE